MLSATRCSTIENWRNIEPRIIGGTSVDTNTHPWLVRVARKTCGGTIVGWNHVITAAHCCASNYIDVVIGQGWSEVGSELNANEGNNNFQQPPLMASKVTVHPLYNSNTLINDICILEFEQSLPLDQNANPGTDVIRSTCYDIIKCLVEDYKKFKILKFSLLAAYG